MLEFCFCGFTSFVNFVNFQKSMKSNFPKYLWIKLFCRHLVYLGLKNLQYEIRISQISYNKVTESQCQVVFCPFCKFLEIHEEIFLPHFKCLGMRNLQYEVRICQIAMIKSQLQSVCSSIFYE